MILRPGKTPNRQGDSRPFAPACLAHPRSQKPVLRGYSETRYEAKSWKTQLRVCARIEATIRGLDVRFVVPNLGKGSAANGVIDVDGRKQRSS